jgi:predicted extracellular nuclease
MRLKIRVGTFNCENLFARFRFKSNVKPGSTTKDRFTINDLAFEFLDDEEKAMTAKVVTALDADVLALQEVEDFDVLKRFRNQRLKGQRYSYGILVDGNDPRFIDVAVLSRFPLTRVRSHQELTSGKAPVFSRDCLEVDVDVEGRPLTLFVNHFKSMLDKKDAKSGRKNTRARRALQAKIEKELVMARFGDSLGTAPFVVCGDFDDYLGPGQGTTDGIADLVKWEAVENVVDRLPEAERWTHF